METNAAEEEMPVTGPSPDELTFIASFRAAFDRGDLVRLTLSKNSNLRGARRAVGRLLVIGGKRMLSVEFDYEQRVETKNFDASAAELFLADVAGSQFRALTLFTPESDLLLHFAKKRSAKLFRSKPTFKEAAVQTHNRVKEHLIPQDSAYLRHLGITSTTGSIRPDKADKFRQINKFIEIFDSLVRSSNLQSKGSLKVLDYGSGKSYLTFAIYDFLTRVKSLAASVIGVEQRPELVDQCNQLRITVGYPQLVFRRGEIGSVSPDGVDVVVALHACDTATDDALAQAINAKVPVIAVAPCCQKYVRPKMRAPKDLAFISKHGIMDERLAESVTNGLRALTLEAYGYTAKVFEFVSDSHTAKNVMITAVLTSAPDQNAVAKLKEAKAAFGLEDFYLDKVLGIC